MLPGSASDEDAYEGVRAIVEAEFSKLKKWLDARFQHQEHDMNELLVLLSSQSERTESAHLGSKESGGADAGGGQPIPATDLFPSSETLRQTSQKSIESVPSPKKAFEEKPSPKRAFEEMPSPPLPGCPEEIPVLDLSGDTPCMEDDAVEKARLSRFPTMEMSRIQDDSDWQTKLMDVFDQLDLDNSGSIDRKEFMEAFDEVGMPPGDAAAVFRTMDKTDNGQVDRIEWLHIIEQASRGSENEANQLSEFIEALAARQKTKGRIYQTDHSKRNRFILRHDTAVRMVWDLTMMALLFYISITLPYSLGFGQSEILDRIDRVFDMLFCCDVILNFRTTYSDRDETIIVDPKLIACKYLKTWFLLDFMSSMPFDLITAGLMPSLQPARLLKIGKIAKVMKLLRISKMMKVFAGSELMEKVEERSSTKAHQTLIRILKLAALAFVLSHWLACFGQALDDASLDSYFSGEPNGPSSGQRYLAAMYWAMTTLSTVGYGDITPKSDAERAYAMLSMIIGGAFYGYIVGCVTSIVSDMDLNARAFYDRMDLIQSWLDCHEDIPKLLRRRARKHFKLTLSSKSAIDDSSVVGELSPELRADICFFIIHEQVRRNPMFCDISNSALANLVDVLTKNHTNAEEFIVKTGDPGLGMYILVEGIARYDKGFQWRPPGADQGQRFHKLIQGDSFGEEIIFGMEETYTYTIVAITDCVVHFISEDGFRDKYRNMPELRNTMYSGFMKSRKSKESDVLPAEEADQGGGEGHSASESGQGGANLKSWTKGDSGQTVSANPYARGRR